MTVIASDHAPAAEVVDDEQEAGIVLDKEAEAAGQPQEASTGRPVIATALLAAHPGNVRADLDLTEEFLASVRELGILTPLRVTPAGDGGYRVIEGHRRLAAAIHVGLGEMPCDLVAEREGDEAGQYLDMYAANHHRKDLTALEEMDALFAASAAGASKTRIRKATGLGREQVSAALAAGRLTEAARDAAQGLGYELTLDQLALLAEFDGDPDAVDMIINALSAGRSGEHAAERIRRQRADAAAHDQLVEQLAADGYAVTGSLPLQATLLSLLQHDGAVMEPEAHTGCPGRGVYFHSWAPLEPVHYCADREAYGHPARFQASALSLGDGGASPEAAGISPAGAGQSGPPDPARRLVIEGNQAWTACCTVRQRWVKDKLLARRSAPKEAMPFIAAQLVGRPGPVRDRLAHATAGPMFHQLTGGAFKAEQIASWPAGRLPLVPLAAIITAHEEQAEGPTGRATWRTDRQRAYWREDSGAYLRFLAIIGYELSAIEQAVADGVPYTGDQPDGDLGDAETVGEQGGEKDVPTRDETVGVGLADDAAGEAPEEAAIAEDDGEARAGLADAA
jgi:ParB family transcriptional regulator, chromosome partitioning protein